VIVVTLLFAATYGFRLLPKNFFPDSTRPQFTVDVWLPEGTHIGTTESKLVDIAEYISSLDGITNITTFVGSGAMRFALVYDPESPISNYGQLLVDVDDYRKIKRTLLPAIIRHLESHYPDAMFNAEAFRLGPGGNSVEARLIGPD
jgi:multidrug efflux pump subunit AcrB